jgi:hypothetical protein
MSRCEELLLTGGSGDLELQDASSRVADNALVQKDRRLTLSPPKELYPYRHLRRALPAPASTLAFPSRATESL